MTDPARTAVAVTFLAEDTDARRLVLAWPTIPRDLEGAALARIWGRAAGVPASRTVRLGELLLRHELVRPDGSVDPEALRVIQHVAAETLRTAKRRKSR